MIILIRYGKLIVVETKTDAGYSIRVSTLSEAFDIVEPETGTISKKVLFGNFNQNINHSFSCMKKLKCCDRVLHIEFDYSLKNINTIILEVNLQKKKSIRQVKVIIQYIARITLSIQ